MRSISPGVLAITLITAAVCQAETRNYRNEAASVVERMQMKAPPTPLYAEYGNIVETFAKAEELFEQKHVDEAERLFHLTLLKSSLYEEKVLDLKETPGSADKANPASSHHPIDTNSGKDADDVPRPIDAPLPNGVRPDRTTRPSTAMPASSDPAIGTSRTGLREGFPARGESVPNTPVTQAEEESETSPIPSSMIIGKKTVYTVKKGESLRTVGARFGVNWKTIARENGLDPGKNLKPGQKLRINTTRIIPKAMLEGIVINIPERTLYLFKGKKLEKTLPVGLGMRKSHDASPWQTPTGKFRIVSKVKDPTWFVPPSIQSEMRQKGKTVKSIVPPGDRNPLGKYALKTSMAGIMIHGTISPDSVYGFNSHGCIRVLPRNMQEIYNDIRVNTGGEIIYQPVKIALSDDGRIFLEVHGDIYDRYKNLEEVAKALIIRNNAQQKVDWEKVRTLVKRKSGIPEDVTMQAPETPLRTSMNRVSSAPATR